MPPTPAVSKSRTACPPNLTCPRASSQEYPGCSCEQIADEPTPSLHPHYRSFITTTGRSASGRRIGTQRLRFPPCDALPLARPRPTARTCPIDTRFPTFRAGAADRARAAFTPDTTWPISGHPPGSSRRLLTSPVSMSFLRFDASSADRLRSPSRSPPDASRAPFPHRSPRRSSANAA
jgi:hypothetical protein